MQLKEGQTLIKPRFVGIDSGRTRCGIAVADISETIASPLAVIATEPRATLSKRLIAAIESCLPCELVLGLPLDEYGREGPAALFAREIGELLAAGLDCPLHYCDERFSTRGAQAIRRDSGRRGKQVNKDIDAAAAAVILQSFLDGRRTGT